MPVDVRTSKTTVSDHTGDTVSIGKENDLSLAVGLDTLPDKAISPGKNVETRAFLTESEYQDTFRENRLEVTNGRSDLEEDANTKLHNGYTDRNGGELGADNINSEKGDVDENGTGELDSDKTPEPEENPLELIDGHELVYQEYNTRVKNEETNEVTGIAVTKHDCQMILCDYRNGTIKLVDRFFNVMFKYLSCFKPYGVAVLDQKFFVVTYPFVRMMQYFKFKAANSKFAPWFPVKAQNEYYGVCGVQDRIVAVCKYDGDNLKDIPSVHILNRQGIVINIVSKNHEGKQLFVDPDHISMHPTRRLVYVSDGGGGAIFCLNLAGEILSSFTARTFSPRGISVDDSKGLIYVNDTCCEGVIKLNQDLEPMQKIKAKCDSMPGLMTAVYCSKSDRLIVSMNDSDYLKVFVV